jgi:long-chain acyl-CoA synthetase
VRLLEVEVPIIAAVNSVAVGLGATLPLAACRHGHDMCRRGYRRRLFHVVRRGGYYLDDSGARFAFVGDEVQLPTMLSAGRAAALKKIVVMDPSWAGELGAKNVLSLAKFLEPISLDCDTFLREQVAIAKADELASIGYTSGTTGFPKGAMLSHLSLLAGAHVATTFCPIMRSETQRLVVHLPMSHTVARARQSLEAALPGLLSSGVTKR